MKLGGPAKAIYVYIQSDFGGRLTHCSPTQDDDDNPEDWTRRVVQSSAEMWNEYAIGLPFVYGGTVPTSFDETACTNYMVKRPAVFVRFVEGCDVTGQTCDPNSVKGSLRRIPNCNDAVVLSVYANDTQIPTTNSDCTSSTSNSWNWLYGSLLESISGTETPRNLRDLLNHELGHALNLGHATDDSASVVKSVMAVGVGLPTGKGQQLWNWDEDCSDMYNLGRQDVRHRYRSWRPAVTHAETLIQ